MTHEKQELLAERIALAQQRILNPSIIKPRALEVTHQSPKRIEILRLVQSGIPQTKKQSVVKEGSSQVEPSENLPRALLALERMELKKKQLSILKKQSVQQVSLDKQTKLLKRYSAHPLSS